MSEVIWISTETPAQPIASRLQQAQSFLQEAGIQLTTEVSRSRLLQFVGCQVCYAEPPPSEQASRLLCRQYIANVLTDILVDEWQPLTLGRILRRHYGYLTPTEQTEIVHKALDRLAQAGGSAPLYQASQKSRVREALSHYLADENFVNLDGFLNFRLGFYQSELEEVLRAVVDEHLGDKESQEFVRLLQSFLQILEPKCDVAHLLITGEAEFAILDEQGELLRSDVLETVIAGEGDAPEECEDVLISALLTIAPRHLVVHAGTFLDLPDLLGTLQRIWQRRLETCTDCDLCARLLTAQRHPDRD